MKYAKTPPHFLWVSQSFSLFKHVKANVCLFLQNLRSPLLLCVLAIGFIQTSYASDLEKEKRWEEQISDSLLDGEAIQLNNGTHDFFAIETLAEEPKELGLIIMHGIGIHPDWPAVIQPLRVELAEQGWHTLSIQLPVLKNEAEGKDYEPLMAGVPARVDAGIDALAKQGAKRVAIIAHSMGARMAAYYLANKNMDEVSNETPIVAFVSIGMGADEKNYLAKINIPVFDIVGENDLASVLEDAPKRLKAYGENKHFKQITVADANHFFDEQDEALVNTVAKVLAEY